MAPGDDVLMLMAIRAYQKFVAGSTEFKKKLPENFLFWKELRVHDTEFLIKMICCLDPGSPLCLGKDM